MASALQEMLNKKKEGQDTKKDEASTASTPASTGPVSSSLEQAQNPTASAEELAQREILPLSSDAANFFEMTEPKLGESINNVWLQLATERDSLACDLNAIYYGNLSTVVNGTGETEEESDESGKHPHGRGEDLIKHSG